jgi:hypothetical protein
VVLLLLTDQTLQMVLCCQVLDLMLLCGQSLDVALQFMQT